jgi:type IV secretion system protein VirD4
MTRIVTGVLDEASSLGPLQAIDDMLAIGRGYGLRLQFYFQSVGQLKKCYPEGQDQTFMSNTIQTFFGVNDQQTADYVSARAGETTIIADSGGTSTGKSRQTSHVGKNESVTHSTNANHNWAQLGRKLLKPEEVMALDPRLAVTFTPGLPPICTRLVRYYEEKALFKRHNRLKEVQLAIGMVLKSAFLLLLAGCVLLAATETSKRGSRHEGVGGKAFWANQGKP